VLVQVTVPAALTAARLAVTVNGDDVSSDVKLAAHPDTFVGLVKDLDDQQIASQNCQRRRARNVSRAERSTFALPSSVRASVDNLASGLPTEARASVAHARAKVGTGTGIRALFVSDSGANGQSRVNTSHEQE